MLNSAKIVLETIIINPPIDLNTNAFCCGEETYFLESLVNTKINTLPLSESD